MTWTIGTWTVALALLLASGNVARADVILYSNIAAVPDGSDAISATPPPPNVGGPLADSFSTPAGYVGSLTDVKVNLTGTPDGGSISIDLLSDNSGVPG